MRIDRRFQGDILTDSTPACSRKVCLEPRCEHNARFTVCRSKKGRKITGTEEKAIKEVVEPQRRRLANLKALSDNAKDLLPRAARRGTLGS